METKIQYRIVVPTGKSLLTEFDMQGKHYTITGVSKNNDLMPNKLPMGVLVTGTAIQYNAKTEDGKAFDVFIYYYISVQGIKYAVIEAMRGEFEC